MVLLLVFMQLTRDLFAIAKFLSTEDNFLSIYYIYVLEFKHVPCSYLASLFYHVS